MHFFKQFDFLSHEAKFTFNTKGDIRLKTTVGGLICILAILLTLGLSIYFIISLFKKDNQSVVYSSNFSPYTNLTDSHRVPFLFRLSDGYNVPYKEDNRIYKLAFTFWYGGSNLTDENSKQTRVEIPMERCSLEKHFSVYKDLFSSMTDLTTFYCPNIRDSDMGIYGTYANVKPFGYYHAYVYMCLNQTENDNCLPKDEIEKILGNTYLDLRTVDYSIDNFNSKEVRKINVKSERFMLSDTVYKRIWIYFNEIDYVTDDGILFPKDNRILFHQYDSVRIDIDRRDLMTTTIPGTFATLTVLSTGNIIKYYRKFLKIQDCIATVGGVAKFFSVIALILNYFYSQNSFYLFIMNHFHSVCELTETEKSFISNYRKKVKTINKITGNREDFTVSFESLNAKRSIFRKEKPRLSIKKKIEKELISKWHRMIFPFSCSKNYAMYKQVFQFYKEHINTKLNIINILTKLEQCSKKDSSTKPSFIQLNEIYENYKKKDNKKLDFGSNLMTNTLNEISKTNDFYNNYLKDSGLQIRSQSH